MTHYLMVPRKDLGSYGSSAYTIMEESDPRRQDREAWYELDPGVIEGGIFIPSGPFKGTRWRARYKVYPDMSAKFLDEDGNIVERVGSCSFCKKGAAVNTPMVDPKQGVQSPLWCDNCAKDSATLLVGIEQTMINGLRQFKKQYGIVCKRGIVAHLDVPWEAGGRVKVAWFHGGRTSIPDAREKAALYGNNENPGIEKFLDAMADRQDAGLFYCTKCGNDLPEKEIAGRPLFAGLACNSCNEKHEQHLEQQRKAGKICRRCAEPFDNCCC